MWWGHGEGGTVFMYVVFENTKRQKDFFLNVLFSELFYLVCMDECLDVASCDLRCIVGQQATLRYEAEFHWANI